MDMYCQIFIDTDQSRDAILHSLAEWSGGDVRFRTVIADLFEADVSKNKEFDEYRRHDKDDGFLFYPYYLDVEPKPNVAVAVYVDVIRRLVAFLKGRGMRVVAACDFEDLLTQEL
jgi:hypothetical protein